MAIMKAKAVVVFIVQILFLSHKFINVHCKSQGETSSEDNINILIFGGNGFIGASTVEKLLARGRYTITLVNRGNWYWDSNTRVQPFVNVVKCDRMQNLQKCSDLHYLVWENEDKYKHIDVVIDFSAYHPFQIKDTLEMLKGRIGRYIYISSDSVYEVCVKEHSEPTKETDAIRPASQEVRDEYIKKDDYGNRKLACEEELVSQRNNGGIPFVALRLPDVMGPRDNTFRWWIYQLWLKLEQYLERKMSIPSYLVNKPNSLVYVEDVADVIIEFIESDLSSTYDQTYNLGFEETPTLMEILTDMKTVLNLTGPNIEIDHAPDALHLYPSVTRGPVDISKIKATLNWSPTPWKTAVSETIKFYEQAISDLQFELQRKEIIRTLQTYFTKKPENVIVGLKDVYGITFPQPKEEL